MGWLVISDCAFTCAEERDGETRLAGRIGGKFTKPPGSPKKSCERRSQKAMVNYDDEKNGRSHIFVDGFVLAHDNT